MKKVIILVIMLFVVSGCATKEVEVNQSEFQAMYNNEKDLVERINYEELLDLIETDTGVVFIGEENNKSKNIAKIFCEVLCECGVNKAYFLKIEDVNEDDLKNLFKVDEINYPLIVSFKDGAIIKYYDIETKVNNVKEHINDLVLEVSPAVCEEVC